ncbi:hypothetical protein VN97_g9643 [Penicillium thymicola]|uniref:Endopolyphosphatase n=1 Tax=Penicillium thymicola TaxID=293382 RepID=A0AAI9TAK3_PENTH|nr:hypothetical protein VN97_g9643 [Penicillium thymicola]
MLSIFLFLTAAIANPLQQPLTGYPSRQLHGRFLHITDFHPDRLYKPGTSIDRSCHRGKGPSGYFGAEGTDCDAPFTLIDETFRWIEDNLKDEIDFVIWTGDSARHDNDEKLPRTADEILDLNTYLSQKWVAMFSANRASSVARLSVPVIPTFGNNDIMPHNIFDEGPNKWTKRFAEIWNAFIPEDQRHTFVLGGWFTTEVVPGQLAVISLNTMYFFDSNSAVDGCKAKSEPGYEHMEWLRIQLKILRSRNMKAILMGHVPPARSSEKQNWDETCWQKYTLWVHQYRDVVVGTLYGHMNIDHFIMQDSKKVDIASADGQVSTNSKSDYLESLRSQWSDLPSPPTGFFEELDAELETSTTLKKGKKEKKKRKFLDKIGGPWAERYSVSLVSPSLVPNFFPSLRVIDYNISGVDVANRPTSWNEVENTVSDGYTPLDTQPSDDPTPEVQKKKKKKKKGKKKPDFKVPDGPSPAAPPGPAYSNQPFTFLGYTQYYANITQIHEEIDLNQLTDPSLNFEVEYTTNDDVYQMKDLTVRSFFQLAGRIAEENTPAGTSSSADWFAKKRKSVNTIWQAFLRRAYVGERERGFLLWWCHMILCDRTVVSSPSSSFPFSLMSSRLCSELV